MLGDDLARDDADDRASAGPPGTRKSSAETSGAFMLSRPIGATAGRAANSASSTGRPPAITCGDGAGLEIVEEDDVGAPAGRDQAAVAETEGGGGAQGGGAIDRERRRAAPDQRADHVVEMALLGDVERIAVVGAKREERRRLDG